MHAFMYVFKCVRTYARMSLCVCVYVLCMYVYMYVCMCVYVCIYVCILVLPVLSLFNRVIIVKIR
jgi:nuclear pore complex protein Nup62